MKYCRGQQHHNKVKKESVEKIINQVVLLLEAQLTAKSIQISLQPESNKNKFVTDEAAMMQVLMNIMINAVDAVEKNGRINIESGRHEDGFLIRISDDGPGIDESVIKNVFQSFVTYKEEGTGLGLSISKRIVERLGGKIFIEESTLGGAAFSIFLPDKKL